MLFNVPTVLAVPVVAVVLQHASSQMLSYVRVEQKFYCHHIWHSVLFAV